MFPFIFISRYQCQLSLFLELNFKCHVPTVLGKKFREYSACLSLCREMFIKLSGHFRYSEAYNRNFTVFFSLYSRIPSQGHLSTTSSSSGPSTVLNCSAQYCWSQRYQRSNNSHLHIDTHTCFCSLGNRNRDV